MCGRWSGWRRRRDERSGECGGRRSRGRAIGRVSGAVGALRRRQVRRRQWTSCHSAGLPCLLLLTLLRPPQLRFHPWLEPRAQHAALGETNRIRSYLPSKYKQWNLTVTVTFEVNLHNNFEHFVCLDVIRARYLEATFPFWARDFVPFSLVRSRNFTNIYNVKHPAFISLACKNHCGKRFAYKQRWALVRATVFPTTLYDSPAKLSLWSKQK